MTTHNWSLQDEGPLRQHFVNRLIDRDVKVVKIGAYKPKNDPRNVIYVPIPEYGIALLYVKKENDDV